MHDAGKVSLVSNCAEFEKMHILRNIWCSVGPCSMSRQNPSDPMKVVIILDLPPPTSITQLRSTLGHTRYYQKFIRGYTEITAPMEKLLRKDAKFDLNKDCQGSLDKLKNKMATAPILIFPY